MDYHEFLQGKMKVTYPAGIDIAEGFLNDVLFPFQKYATRKALQYGKYALFEECGLGKIAPLQLETIERAIHLWTNPGETVFTPFLGIGSEVYQAVKMGRKGKGIELKKSYFDVAAKNVRNAVVANYQLTAF
jgi:DNA modification methylase